MNTPHIQRMIRSGMQQVWRNPTVTVASLLVTTVTLCIIAMLVFSNAVLSFSLDEMAKRVDVNVYFLPNAPEEVVLDAQQRLESLPEIASVEYVSREDALVIFRERHNDDQLTLQALEELGENPLGASLNIRAHTPDQYQVIADFLEPDGGLPGTVQSMIEQVNYHQNALVIKRIHHLMDTVQRMGLVLSLVFIILSLLITINTIRLAIYSSREEISVMQMIGAERTFVQGPFYVAGIFYGLVSSAITIVLLYPLTSWIAQQTTAFFGGLSLFDYYISNFVWLIIMITAIGVVMSVIASAVAVRSYLRA
jgi:cell division transport system permease protein